jgi:16S rRNA processing protein RimM
MKKEQLVIGGKLHGTHGLKGDLKIELFNPRLKIPDTIYIKSEEGNFIPLKVKAFSRRKQLINFEGYDDVEKAKKIKHRYFYIPTSILPEKKEDEYYEYELLDSDVYFKNKKIGKVIKVDDRLSTAYLIIKCEDEKIRYLPFINQFVKTINVDDKIIEINPPEGWFSL